MDKKILIEVLKKINVPKLRHNEFGNFNFRNASDILKVAMPLLYDAGLDIEFETEVDVKNDAVYVQVLGKIVDDQNQIWKKGNGFAREEISRPKFSPSQLTGAAITFAKKYALDSLFCLCDDDDPDGLPPTTPTSTPPVERKTYNVRTSTPAAKNAQNQNLNVCADCGKEITNSCGTISQHKFGRPLCQECQKKIKV